MPAEYRNVQVDVLCNDCGEKCTDLKFHFYGVKCVKCGSYNTRILATRGYDPTAAATAAPADPTAAAAAEQNAAEQLEDILDDALREFEGEEYDEEGEEDEEFDDAESEMDVDDPDESANEDSMVQ